jgi:hypothetical protein
MNVTMADTQRNRIDTPVYGNLAYDLDALVRERNLEEAGKLQEEQQQRQPRVRTQPAVRPRQRVSPLVLGSVVLLAAMVVGLLLGYVQLTKISTSVSSMKSELSELEDEHVALLTKYEQTYDLATVKETAEAAGMSKPSSGQIEYVDLGGPDAAVVYRADGQSAAQGLLDSVKQGLAAAVEYFR